MLWSLLLFASLAVVGLIAYIAVKLSVRGMSGH